MKRILLVVSLVFFSCQFASSQKASDVLEDGVHVKTGQKIFLQYNNNVLKFDLAKSAQDAAASLDFTTLQDSLIFLVSKNGVNIYLMPLNPLNFSYTTETKEIADPINEAAATALNSIIDVLSATEKTSTIHGFDKSSTMTVFDTCTGFNDIETTLKLIQTELKKEQKDAIVKAFKSLKALSFLEEKSTISDLEKIEKSKGNIEKHFAAIDSMVEATGKKIESYNCDKTSGFITKYIFGDILKDLRTTAEEQKKRLRNLQNAYDLVKKEQEKATAGGGVAGLNWCLKLDEVPSKEGKISVYTIIIKVSGYKLSDKDEIVAVETKDTLTRTIRVRKFQRFVPEVSVGTAYTFFKYNTYGTTSDSTGQQYVASPTKNLVRNINITTMINFNYYIPNSPVHPLYQIGVGVNAGIPTLLTGLGGRLNIKGIRRIAVSGGIAMTWVKKLDELKVGDKISGTDDIDKDLKFEFSWPPRFYFGLQYNF